MFDRLWPIAVIVISNTLYQICAKEAPADMDPFASLTITYILAAVSSLAFYYALRSVTGTDGLAKEYRKVNWAPVVLGVSIVGLEFGWIMAYKAGWQVSMGYIVVTAIVSSLLLVVGYLIYKEKLDRNKLIGIGLCLVGLIFINLYA